MEESKAYISRLLTEKLTGVIHADDEVRINRLIATDDDVRAEWEWMQEKIAAAPNFNPHNSDKVWNQLSPIVQRKKRPGHIIAISSAAAACVAGALYLSHAFQPAPIPTTNFFARNTVWPKDSIVMQGEEGQRLNLTAIHNQTINTLTITDSSLQIHHSTGNHAQWQTLLVPAMMTYKVILADGSVAKLNSGTRIKFPLNFTGDKREVFIDGEAFFSIAADTKKPFIVRTPKTDIQVLGTQFNVNTYDTAYIQTALVDGAVSTTSLNKKLVLKPGQEAVFTANNFTTQDFDPSTTLSWMEGAYYFHDVPLKNLSGILSRWFNTGIQFDTPSLQNKMFSGALLKDQPLQVFLENLELSDNIHAKIINGIVHFK